MCSPEKNQIAALEEELALEKDLSVRLRAVMLDCIGRPAGVAGPMLKEALEQTGDSNHE